MTYCRFYHQAAQQAFLNSKWDGCLLNKRPSHRSGSWQAVAAAQILFAKQRAMLQLSHARDQRREGSRTMHFITKVAIGVVASALLPTASEATANVVPSGATFMCTPTAVWDGDGPIWCAEGPKIRIAGVAARELDGRCSRNHPCPSASGIDARNRLVRLLGGPKGKLKTGQIKVRSAALTCVSEGSAGGNRTAAWCRSSAVGDLSCAVVAAGGAVRWQRHWGRHRC